MEIKIFLSYAREDQPRVASIKELLSTAVLLQPWMDVDDIPGGSSWSLKIRNAIADSDLFLACLSTQSVNKEGYIQEELDFALETWQAKGLDASFLIPLRLDSCEIPEKLRKIQKIDFFEPKGAENLLRAIKHASNARIEAMSFRQPMKPRPNSTKSMKKTTPLFWAAADALGIINCVEQLEDEKWGPTGCGERARRSLKIAGLQGSKCVDADETFEEFKDCLTRLTRIRDSSVKFLLINPLSDTLSDIKLATKAPHNPDHDYRILERYHQLAEKYNCFEVRLYEHFPYFRIVVIDEMEMAVSRYNISKARKEGWKAPHLILKNDEQPGRPEASSLFYAFERYFEQVWHDEHLSKPIQLIMDQMNALLKTRNS